VGCLCLNKSPAKEGEKVALERDARVVLIMVNIRLSGIDTEVRVGKEIKAGNRTIWPVMRIHIIKT
jgi:hypothetical protein